MTARTPRHDEWTDVRKKTFLATLRQTGCVRDACRVIGMSSTSAYRLRKKDEAFRDAWDAALLDARRGLIAVAHERAVVGRETVIIRGGEEVERRIQQSDAMLTLLIKQGDLDADGSGRFGRVGNRTADRILTAEDWHAGMGFDEAGRKCDRKEANATLRERVSDRLNQMRAALERDGQRVINVKTGEGITAEVLAAARKFAGDVDGA